MTIKKLFSSTIVVLTILVGATFASCNKDELIQTDLPPQITLDYESLTFEVKIGEELVISPTYLNVDNSSVTYSWRIDGVEVSSQPIFRHTWQRSGNYYVTITVTTPGGSDSEEFLVKVLDPAPPVISLPVASDQVTIALGSDYVITPEVSNSAVAGFSISWSIGGSVVSTQPSYTFHADALGQYPILITASNPEGSDSRTLTINVVDKLPYELSFPTPSYFSTSTDRYTFAGRPVYLTPITAGSTPSSWAWTVNGAAADCNSETFVFTPDAPGEYLVSLTIDNSATASVRVICVDATESSRFRPASASSSPYSNKVYEWVPAPGQFIGETQTGGMTGNETTHAAATAWAHGRLAAQNYVSLGGFGGYIIVGFDHSISKADAGYDFTVMANAFLNAASGDGGSNEPGIIYVMQDVNGNGLPDDEWYELRGSETGKSTTYQDYAVTYYRPAAAKMNVQWTDNRGLTGTIDYLSAFHRQDYYYPAWIDADSYTLRGTRLQDRTTQDAATGMWDNWLFDWGYADNLGSDNIAGANAQTGQGQRNGFLISNAIFPDLSAINLQYIDFIKIQTGINSKAGWLGEVSTEVFSVCDYHLK